MLYSVEEEKKILSIDMTKESRVSQYECQNGHSYEQFDFKQSVYFNEKQNFTNTEYNINEGKSTVVNQIMPNTSVELDTASLDLEEEDIQGSNSINYNIPQIINYNIELPDSNFPYYSIKGFKYPGINIAKTEVHAKSLQINKRYYRGIKYYSELIKSLVVGGQKCTYKELTDTVCKIVLPEKTGQINGLLKKDRETKDVTKRIHDALNALIGASILGRKNDWIFLPHNVFCKEVYTHRKAKVEKQYETVKNKRIELIGMIKKYSLIKGQIIRNQNEPSNSHFNLPFVIVRRGSKDNGCCKVATTSNDQKAIIYSQIRLQVFGDFKTMEVAKFLPMDITLETNTFTYEAISMIKKNFGEIPSYQIDKNPK